MTGGAGFIAAHCIVRLLEDGYRVRTTVRSLERATEVRKMTGSDTLEFAAADLLADEGWAEAVADCAYVLHVASPVPLAEPENEDDVIRPAREGALRVLRAADRAGVRRTVLTSSFAAVKYGHPAGRILTEDDWSDPDAGEPMAAYAKSKLAAERAAWDFAATSTMELVTVNPVAVFGPALGSQLSLWADLVDSLLRGRLPLLPRMNIAAVDVRDVADLHVRAMTHPAAAGRRFLARAGLLSLPEIATLLRANLGDAARAVPTRSMPDLLVRLAARFNPRAAMVVPELGAVRDASSDQAKLLLDWHPRPATASVLDTARSLLTP